MDMKRHMLYICVCVYVYIYIHICYLLLFIIFKIVFEAQQQTQPDKPLAPQGCSPVVL
jgi:hypothetical protein